MFFASIILALISLIVSILISIGWIAEIACYFGYFIAIYLVTFVALIPGFNYVFTFFSLLFNKNKKKKPIKCEEDVTVLVPVYDAENLIKETLESIKN